MISIDENIEPRINAVFVQEGFAYSKDSLITMLSLNEKNFERDKAVNLINSLLYRHLLTKSCKKTPESSEDDYATDWENLDYDESENWNTLSFAFVGLYYFNGILIKSIPKYFHEGVEATNTDSLLIDKDIVLPKFKQVLRVIEKYKDNLSQKVSYANGDTRPNHLSLVLSILEDYYENGAYNNDQIVKEINGNGTIDWDYTVNNYYPLIKNNKPYYLEYRTIKRHFIEDNYFYRLHKTIITHCSRELKECDLIDLFDFDELELSDEELNDFGEKDVILYNIDRELNIQFNTQKQETLKLLKAYIDSKEKSISESDDFKLYRVGRFDQVWEEVCRYAVGDDLNSKLGGIIIDRLKKSSSEHLRNLKVVSTFKDIMERPKWYPEGENNKYATSAPLKLDSIKYHNNSLYIFDAKYYVPIITPRESDNNEEYYITDMPGVADITKQYLYQLGYKSFADATGIKIVSNNFLMPKDDDSEPYPMCTIKMEMFEQLDASLQNINVLQVSAKDMYECYLRENAHSIDYFLVDSKEVTI